MTDRRYELRFRPAALRQLRKLDTQIARRVKGATEALHVEPRPPGIKALIGQRGWLRIRVGEMTSGQPTLPTYRPVIGSSRVDLGAPAATRESLEVTGCGPAVQYIAPPASVYNPVHGSPTTAIKTAGGAGGARSHDRRIMRTTATCTARTSCTDTTEPRH